MKLSNETISVLKNFSQINPSVLFKPGQTIRTISPQKTVMAAANVSEMFEKQAGVYDVNRFLATLSLFSDEPNVNFGESQFEISSGKSNVKYTYTSENMIVTPPDRDISIPNVDANAKIAWSTIDSVIRAAGVLGLPEIAFISDESGLSLAAVDSKNPTADTYSVAVEEDTGFEPFRMIIKVDNLKLLPSDYDVALSSSGMAHFKSEKVQYWIAIESR